MELQRAVSLYKSEEEKKRKKKLVIHVRGMCVCVCVCMCALEQEVLGSFSDTLSAEN